MPAGLPVAVMLLAQAASAAPTYGPAPPPAPKAATAPVKTADASCRPTNPDPGTREIVICAEKPQGYRLNPDVLKAKREKHGAGRPTRPGPISMKDDSCRVVGPMGCRGQVGFNVIAAAATAAQIADRLSKGQEVGSLLLTDPHPSEYRLYLAAKAEREAKEAAAKAKALAAKMKAAPATATANPVEPANLETAPAK